MQSTSGSPVADTQVEHSLCIYCCITNYPQNTVAYNNSHFITSREFVGLEFKTYSDG